MKIDTRIIKVNNKSFELSLDWILGFFEGDGSLTIQFKSSHSHKTGKQIVLIFEIHQHVIDVDLLRAISIFLNCGKVEIGRKVGNPDTWVYRLRISSQKDVFNTLLPVLKESSFMLNKRQHNWKLFLKACEMVKNKKHTSKEGQEILQNIRSQLSSKLSFEEKLQLPKSNTPLNKQRVTGFTDAEGHFSFTMPKNKDGSWLSPVFSFNISQGTSELDFLKSLKKFFECGNVYTKNQMPEHSNFIVNKKQDLADKILPFFETNKLQTIKQLSFLRWKKAFNIYYNNKPLLNEHINELNYLLLDISHKRPKK